MKSPPVQVPGLGRARGHGGVHRQVRRRAEAAGRQGDDQGRSRLRSRPGLTATTDAALPARRSPSWRARTLSSPRGRALLDRPGHALRLGAAPRGEPLRGAALRRAVPARAPGGGGRAVGLARADPRGPRARSSAWPTTPTRCSPTPGCASGARGRPELPFRRGRARCRCRSTCRARSRSCSSRAELDFVHVHEPFAPSASSAALRHSRALNVGTFHSPTERFVSTQVARRLVELLFGRLDGRTASFAATRDLVAALLPRRLPRDPPGRRPASAARARDGGETVEIVFSAEEERGALRLFLRALRRLPTELDWRATIWSRDPAPAPAVPLPRALRERVRLAGPGGRLRGPAPRARDDRRWPPRAGAAPGAAAACCARMAGGAVPVASRLPQYEEALRDGELGPAVRAARRATRSPPSSSGCVARPRAARAAPRRAIAQARPELEWSRVADEFEALYARDRGAPARRGRQAAGAQAARGARASSTSTCTCTPTTRPTARRPVDTLLETAKQRRPGRDRGHRPQRDLGRARGARAGRTGSR